MLFKGKVADKAGGILLTEFFFCNIISELTDYELLELLSIFELRERAGGNVKDCVKQYSDAFINGLNLIIHETKIALEI